MRNAYDKETFLKLSRQVMLENMFAIFGFIMLAIEFNKWWLALFSLLFQQRVAWRKGK